MYYILYAYWFVLALALIGVVVLAIKKPTVADYIGRLAGKLRKNNNWLWGAFVVVGILLTINALLAGRGAPTLTSSAREVSKMVANEVDKHPGITHEFQRFLWGTNVAAHTQPAPKTLVPATKNVGRKYHSWWHLITAVVWWLWVIVDYFISRRDEIAKALRRSKHVRTIINNPAIGTTTPAGNATTDGIIGWIKRVFREKGFTFHSFIEVLWEVIVPKALGKWWGRN